MNWNIIEGVKWYQCGSVAVWGQCEDDFLLLLLSIVLYYAVNWGMHNALHIAVIFSSVAVSRGSTMVVLFLLF